MTVLALLTGLLFTLGVPMLSPIAVCRNCAEEFEPVEYVTVPQDPDEPVFCSEDCADHWWEIEQASEAYEQAGWPSSVY